MEGFLGKVGCYIMEYLNDKLRTPAGGRQPNMKEVGSQAYETEGLQSYVQAYEENEEKMPIELQKKESQIEDLQWSITEVRLQRDQALKELEISERYALRLLKQTNQYRVCARGTVIHFHEGCPHYAHAKAFELCCTCMTGGTVLDCPERSTGHT